ncbi:hypothetical protein ACEU6E_06875 [Halorutilales archaeon Cl-col2-1]
MERRDFVKAAAATVFTAGCLGGGTTLDRRDTSTVVRSSNSEGGLSETEFDSFADETADIYGDNGVWGKQRQTPDHELEYVGAWTDGVELPNRSGRSDSAVAVYRIRREGTTSDSYFFWLWNAVLSNLSESSGSDGGVKRIYTGVELDEGYEMGMYSPATDTQTDYTVGVDVFSLEPPKATLAVSNGEVAPVAGKTRVGDAGSYRVDWEGDAEVQSVNAAFEAESDSEKDYRFTWVNGHEATVPLE